MNSSKKSFYNPIFIYEVLYMLLDLSPTSPILISSVLTCKDITNPKLQKTKNKNFVVVQIKNSSLLCC